MNKPCLGCGNVSPESYCDDCTKANRARDRHRSYGRERAYNKRSWRRLSAEARRVQGWCSYLDPDTGTVCGTTDDLTADHTPRAWTEYARTGRVPRDAVQVLCRRHNSAVGPARGEHVRHTDW